MLDLFTISVVIMLMATVLAVAMVVTWWQTDVVPGFGYIAAAQVLMPVGLGGLLLNLFWPNSALNWLSNTLILVGAALLPAGMRLIAEDGSLPRNKAPFLFVAGTSLALAWFVFVDDAINPRIVIMSIATAVLFAMAAIPVGHLPQAKIVRAILWAFVALMLGRAVYSWSAHVEATVFSSEFIYHSLTFTTVSVLGVGLPFAAFFLNASMQSSRLRIERAKAECRVADLGAIQDIISDTKLSVHVKRRALLKAVAQMLGLRVGMIANVVGNRYEVTTLFSDLDTISAKEGSVFELGETVCSELLRKGHSSLSFHNKQCRESLVHPAYDGSCPGAYIGALIESNAGFYGTVSFSDTRSRHSAFDQHEQTIVHTVANWLAADLEQEVHARREARRLNQLETLTDALKTHVAYVDRHYVTRFLNQTFRQMLGPTAQTLVGKHMARVVGDRFFERVKPRIDEVFLGRAQSFEDCPDTLEGRSFLIRYVPDIEGEDEVQGFFAFADEITEYRRREDDLRTAAQRDPLTGLLNRRGLEHALNHITHDQVLALVLIDLDDFKGVNDRHGHGVGDSALCAVARILLEVCRKQDFAVRLGGDEFLLVLDAAVEDAVVVAGRIQDRVEAIATRQLKAGELGASIAVVKSRRRSMKGALSKADALVYMVKRDGGRNIKS